MDIRKIDTLNREEVESFIGFPFSLYRRNKFWVPPFPGEMKLVMDRNRHPFYRHSLADFFIAQKNSEVVGRLAVLKNQNYCDFHQKQIAFVYYLDRKSVV
jgi:hypothetical protein